MASKSFVNIASGKTHSINELFFLLRFEVCSDTKLLVAADSIVVESIEWLSLATSSSIGSTKTKAFC